MEGSAKRLRSRLGYYLRSIPTLSTGITNPWVVVGLLFGRPQIVDLRGGLRFEVRDMMDLWIVKEVCLDRDYETNGVAIEDGWTIVDVGAGIGDYAVWAAQQTPNGRVVAIEASPDSFRSLAGNVARNDVANVQTARVAVAARSGSRSLAAGRWPSQQSMLPADVQGRAEWGHTVPAVSLADVFTEFGIDACDLLKIDCEGCEFEVLLGAGTDTLERVQHIALEYHDAVGRSLRQLIEHLQANGFVVAVAANPVHAEIGFLHARRRTA